MTDHGVNITIGWDGWAGRATLHDTDATQTHTGAHESHARHTSQRSAKLKHLRTERVASPSIAAREQQPGDESACGGDGLEAVQTAEHGVISLVPLEERGVMRLV